jgi:hypothetical protein
MEQIMNSQNEDLDEDAEAAEEFEQHGLALHQLIQDYMDEHDLSDELTALILLGMCIRMRMIGYALETDKPSASGLKTDLDRFRREVDDCIRSAKKSADQFIDEAKDLRAEMEAEMEDGMDGEDEIEGDGEPGSKRGMPS